jgi:hypothetical protein
MDEQWEQDKERFMNAAKQAQDAVRSLPHYVLDILPNYYSQMAGLSESTLDTVLKALESLRGVRLQTFLRSVFLKTSCDSIPSETH